MRPVGAPARAEAAPVSARTALSQLDRGTLGGVAIALVLAGVLYNTVLSFLNGHAMSVSYALVVVTEIAVLGMAVLTLLRSGLRPGDNPALLLLGFFLINACLVSLASGALFIDMVRNTAIIVVFLMLGERVQEQTVRRTFAITSGLVAAFLLLESVSVQTYADLLQPGLYFEQTRGISRFELDEIGLFANAVGFDDRFSILKIVGHRTSSLFLEQVSLANFATVLTIFLVSLWREISIKARIAYMVLIALILVTNNSRTALGISLAAPIVYLLAPKLHRLVGLVFMPLALGAAAIVTASTPPTKDDNLIGRFGTTMRSLSELDLRAFLGGSGPEAIKFADSGYTYLIYASSIIGLLVIWFFVSTIVAGENDGRKRCSAMLCVFMFANLLIGGTAVFSIKIAALLWFLVGFVRASAAEVSEQAGEAQAILSSRPPRRRDGELGPSPA